MISSDIDSLRSWISEQGEETLFRVKCGDEKELKFCRLFVEKNESWGDGFNPFLKIVDYGGVGDSAFFPLFGKNDSIVERTSRKIVLDLGCILKIEKEKGKCIDFVRIPIKAESDGNFW